MNREQSEFFRNITGSVDKLRDCAVRSIDMIESYINLNAEPCYVKADTPKMMKYWKENQHLNMHDFDLGKAHAKRQREIHLQEARNFCSSSDKWSIGAMVYTRCIDTARYIKGNTDELLDSVYKIYEKELNRA